MYPRLTAIRFEAENPSQLARFWAGMLDTWKLDTDGVTLVPTAQGDLPIRFLPGAGPKLGQNQTHFDLTTSSIAGQRDKVALALSRGAHHADVGQRGDEGHVVLADPEGNEFCVIEPDNAFLADCGVLGAVNCDGSMALGHFWSAALGWPLVWDQDEETAIRSPDGGPMITWSGPPVRPKQGRNRLRLELTPLTGDDEITVERLVGLGANVVDTDEHGFELTDPDGNEFTVVSSS